MGTCTKQDFSVHLYITYVGRYFALYDRDVETQIQQYRQLIWKQSVCVYSVHTGLYRCITCKCPFECTGKIRVGIHSHIAFVKQNTKKKKTFDLFYGRKTFKLNLFCSVFVMFPVSQSIIKSGLLHTDTKLIQTYFILYFKKYHVSLLSGPE